MRSAAEAGRLDTTHGPAKDCDACCEPPRCHHRAGNPLMGSSCASECCVRRPIEPIGLLETAWRHRFRIALAGFGASPSAVHSRVRLILSCASPSLQSTSSLHRPGSSCPGAFPGLPSLIATSTGGVHVREHPKLASFRPRRFARPRRLAPLPALRVCFTPQPRPGFALQGVSLARSRTSSSPAVALMSLARNPCRVAPAPEPRAPPSGPCSSRESVAATRWLRPCAPATLLSFVLPRVLLRAPCRRSSPPAPTTAFHGPRRLVRARPGLLLRARLPRSRFPACVATTTCVAALLRGRVHQAIRFDRRTD